MKGCRSLTEQEEKAVLNTFEGVYALRDKAMVLVGLKTGLRISEILSITIRQVYQNQKIVQHLCIPKRHMKGKVEGRTVPLHEEARTALALWLIELNKTMDLTLDLPVFIGRKQTDKAISRVQAWRILENAFFKAGLEGPLATHSLRKTFAQKVHKKLNFSLLDTQMALSHRSIQSTVKYLSGDTDKVNAAILSI